MSSRRSRSHAPDEARPIVCFGDSYTEGTTATPPESYPALLEKSLGIPVVNAGRIGQTAREARVRMDRDVLCLRPRLVIVWFGVNEAFRGDSILGAEMGVASILQALQSNRIPALLVGNRYGKFQKEWDDTLKRTAARFGIPVVVDVLAGILDNPATTRDGYHPNAAGYALVETRIRPAVEAFLGNPHGTES